MSEMMRARARTIADKVGPRFFCTYDEEEIRELRVGLVSGLYTEWPLPYVCADALDGNGWRRIDEFLVDLTGTAEPYGENVMLWRDVAVKLEPGKAYGVVGVGPYQAILAVFERVL